LRAGAEAPRSPHPYINASTNTHQADRSPQKQPPHGP
jgi:hypothetical protein